MQVLVWLLKQADGQNQILASMKEIAEGAGVGVATVERLMSSLVKANVITRPHRYGPWRLNPSVIFQGSHQQRMNILIKYRDESSSESATPKELVDQPLVNDKKVA